MTNSDGQFSLEYAAGWAILTVIPPQGKGRPVYTDDILRRMQLLGIPLIHNRKLREILSRSAGQPVKLVRWPDGAQLAARIEVILSADRMQGLLKIYPPRKGGGEPNKVVIQRALEEKGIRNGIDWLYVEQILENRLYDRVHIVARGQPPVAPKSCHIRYAFDTQAGKPYQLLANGRINLKELNFIHNKKEGDLLAELLPPEPGNTGFNVVGDILPPPSALPEEKLIGGINTRFDPAGNLLYAAKDGNVRFKDGRVIIEPVVVLENVDYGSGNIRFDGAVTITGTVADGFEVESGGCLEIGSYLGKARIRAAAQVLLRAGINGNGEGVIECEGDLYARYIENALIYCKGHLFVEEAIMHSTVYVDGNIVMTGKRAEVIAGRIFAGRSLRCKKLGSVNETPTEVSIGIPPGTIQRQEEFRKQIEAKRRELNQLDDKLKRIEKLINQTLTPESRLLTLETRLLQEVAAQEQVLEGLLQQEALLKSRYLSPGENLIIIEELAYHGTRLSFGAQEWPIGPKGLRKTILSIQSGEILEKGFNSENVPELDFS